MEPTLGCIDLELSNQMAPILAGLIRLTPLLIGLGLQNLLDKGGLFIILGSLSVNKCWTLFYQSEFDLPDILAFREQ